MGSGVREVVVSSEDAVFWMDGRGVWRNRHGRFENPRIIAYFNRSIRRDAGGYHLFQEREGVREKVYFRYAETPLFVVEVTSEPEPVLHLNTGDRIDLDPKGLFVMDDVLFMTAGEDLLKFTDRAMMRLAGRLAGGETGLAIRTGGKCHPIRFVGSKGDDGNPVDTGGPDRG